MAIRLDLDVSALQRVGMDQAHDLVTRVTRRTLRLQLGPPRTLGPWLSDWTWT